MTTEECECGGTIIDGYCKTHLKEYGVNTIQNTALDKAIESLAIDLDSLGWNLPGRIYTLHDVADPDIRMTAEVALGVSPITTLDQMFHTGWQKPEGCVGLILAMEMVRHLSFEELLERHPDAMDKIGSAYERETGTTMPMDEAVHIATHYYYSHVIPSLPEPTYLPDELRMDTRIIIVVQPDDQGMSYELARGKSEGGEYIRGDASTEHPELDWHPYALNQLFKGEHPCSYMEPPTGWGG